MVKLVECKSPPAVVLSALALAVCFSLSAAVGAEPGEPEADREFYSPPRRDARIAPHARVKVAIPAVGAPSLVHSPAEAEPETSAIPYDAEPPALYRQPEQPVPGGSGADAVPPRVEDAETPDDLQASPDPRSEPSAVMAEEARPPEAKVLASLDGREITDREVLRELWLERGRDAFDWLVGRALLEAELARFDLAVTEDEVDARLREHLDGLREMFPDIRRDDDLTRAASGMGLAEYRKRSVWSELALRKVMRRTVVPDESALRAYYADWPARARYIEPDMALVAQIFIAPAAAKGDGVSGATEWADAERRVIEAHSRLRMGEDFLAVASSYASGGHAPRWIGHGELMRELEDAAFSLKIGAMSAPIRSVMGYHIILVQDRKERREPPFEEVRDRVLAEYEERLFVATAGEFMTRLRERAVKDGRLVLGADDLSFPDQ